MRVPDLMVWPLQLATLYLISVSTVICYTWLKFPLYTWIKLLTWQIAESLHISLLIKYLWISKTSQTCILLIFLRTRICAASKAGRAWGLRLDSCLERSVVVSSVLLLERSFFLLPPIICAFSPGAIVAFQSSQGQLSQTISILDCSLFASTLYASLSSSRQIDEELSSELLAILASVPGR